MNDHRLQTLEILQAKYPDFNYDDWDVNAQFTVKDMVYFAEEYLGCRRMLLQSNQTKPAHNMQVLLERTVDFCISHMAHLYHNSNPNILLDLSDENMKGSIRKREIVIARQLFYYGCKALFPDIPLKAIGRFMGHRDHSTVIHGVKTINNLCDIDKGFLKQVNKYRRIIGLRTGHK